MQVNMRPFYWLIVFWGKEHRGHFINLALASLLSEKNIPALHNPEGRNRFLIATTQEDWLALEGEPLFSRLKEWVTPELIEIPFPKDGASKMLSMSVGHKGLTERAFEDKAFAIHLCPDVVYSDGSMAHIQDLAIAGKKVVLTAAVRFKLEGVMRELEEGGYLRKGEPMTMPAREAVSIGLRNQHGEFMASAWTSPFFWDFPVYTWWEVPGEDGIVQHTYSWSPVLVNYGALDEHYTEIFDNWTLDGNYIYQNFKHLEDDIHTVTDSDDVLLLPVTPWEEASPPRTPHWTKTSPIIGNWTRAYLMNKVHNHEVMDPLKRNIFFTHVLWHTRPLNENWEPVKNKILRFLCTNIQSPHSRKIFERQRSSVSRNNNKNSEKYIKYSSHWFAFICFLRTLTVRTAFSARRIPILIVYYIYYKPVLGTIWIFDLLIAYTRITFLAIKGDQKERERITRRFSILRNTFQSRFKG